MPRQIPEYFAILRDGIRAPCLQVLRARACEEDYEYNRHSLRGCYEVVHPRHSDDFRGELIHAPYHTRNDRAIHTLRYLPSEGEEPQEVKFWFTPYVLENHANQVIPLLEFQYRSWIPTGFTPIPLRANLNELYGTLSRIQEERLAEIRHREDNESIRQRDIPFYQPNRYYDRPITPVPRPQTPPRIVETVRVVEVPVERVVVQQRVLPLPKAVGDALLRDARVSKDACPILQLPFSECETLAVSSCFHIFDKASLTRWQQDHTSCPVCRCKIENVVSE
jgi:hypothetical protein